MPCHIPSLRTGRIHTPPIVKHVLAPQDDFGMQKKLGKQTKQSGFGSDPPLVWEKFPRKIVFSEDVPYQFVLSW